MYKKKRTQETLRAEGKEEEEKKTALACPTVYIIGQRERTQPTISRYYVRVCSIVYYSSLNIINLNQSMIEWSCVYICVTFDWIHCSYRPMRVTQRKKLTICTSRRQCGDVWCDQHARNK